MATNRNQKTTVTVCLICLDILKKPKALPCLHTFCLGCLVKYGREVDKDKPGDELPCPLCRQNFKVPAGDFDKLPTNFFIEHLLEADDQSSTSSSLSGCQICEQRNAATNFCVQCSLDMCSNCAIDHSTISALQIHRIVTLEDKNNSQVIQKSRVTYCEKHKDKPLKLYCSGCKVIVCLMCYVYRTQRT